MSRVRRAWRELSQSAVAAGLAWMGLVSFLANLVTAGLSLLGVGLPLLDRTLSGTRMLLDHQRSRVPGPPVRSPYNSIFAKLDLRERDDDHRRYERC
ncbi:hypothetical protein [Micromonospora okii]|uniref:hypothetical protein n=1 Tax=Micromonospora okii TaxID=1182970 RepID=UPI001E5856F4|nr:hypothetical protein [Micromonospora okii]